MPCPFTGPKFVLVWYKFFVPDQKFIYILWQSQTFCASAVKLVFVPTQTFLKRHQMQSNFWAASKNLDRHITFDYIHIYTFIKLFLRYY